MSSLSGRFDYVGRELHITVYASYPSNDAPATNDTRDPYYSRREGGEGSGGSYGDSDQSAIQSNGSIYTSGQGAKDVNGSSLKEKNVSAVDPSTLQGLHKATQQYEKAGQLFSQSVQQFSQSTQALQQAVTSFQTTNQQFSHFLACNKDQLRKALLQKINRTHHVPDTWLASEKQIVDDVVMSAHLWSAPSRFLGTAIAMLCNISKPTQKACEIISEEFSEFIDFVVPEEAQQRLNAMKQELMTKWNLAYGYSFEETAQFIKSVDILAANAGAGVLGGGIAVGARSLITQLKTLPKSGLVDVPITLKGQPGMLTYAYENYGTHLTIFVKSLKADKSAYFGSSTKTSGFAITALKEIKQFASQQNVPKAYLQFIVGNKRLKEIISKRFEYFGDLPKGINQESQIPSLVEASTNPCPTYNIPLEPSAAPLPSGSFVGTTMPGSLRAFLQIESEHTEGN